MRQCKSSPKLRSLMNCSLAWPKELSTACDWVACRDCQPLKFPETARTLIVESVLQLRWLWGCPPSPASEKTFSLRRTEHKEKTNNNKSPRHRHHSARLRRPKPSGAGKG
jgi:hypothetical protein